MRRSPAQCAPIALSRVDALGDWVETIVRRCREAPEGAERAADWIGDNAWRLRRAIRQLGTDLPPSRYRALPHGALAGRDAVDARARLHRLAGEWLDAGGLELTEPMLSERLAEAQDRQALAERELWALAPILRLVCLERFVALVSALFGDLAAAPIELPEPSCHDADPHAAGEAVGALITSLVAIDEIDWPRLVSEVSRVERVLATDPAGIYPAMGEDTRIRYRAEVETLARRSSLAEQSVAERVLDLARAARADALRAHVGYWLLDEGRAALETSLGTSRPPSTRLAAAARRHAGLCYATALVTIAAAALAVPLVWLAPHDPPVWAPFALAALSLLPASVIAVALVNWAAARVATPRALPTMEPRAGIPAGADTAVVVPVIVHAADEVDALVEALETRYLANPDPRLSWVLLSDLPDGAAEHEPEDAAIEAALVAGIEALASRHRPKGGARFYLLHRGRRFNPSEGCWMGHERKRGKLERFNALVLDGWREGFTRTLGDLAALRGTRFVISLDADTTLPPGAAARLVCKMAHPLNRPRRDERSGRVVAGYSVLQPRVETLVHGESLSPFARLFAGDGAIDIYSRAVSDVYQDLFGVAIYTGKGIYDVEAFQRGLDGRVPENRILSHDLFEGLHGRVGLASDVLLYERYPETWAEHALRQHRWIRGDWQLLPWLARHVPAAGGGRLESRFTALDRWKIVDNLRRSLVPPAMLAWFLAAWLALPGGALGWTLLGVGAFAPYLIDDAFASLASATRRRRAFGIAHGLRDQGARATLAIVFLVGDALVALDAIGRTLWRLAVSRRHLLEWTSAARARRDNGGARETRTRRRWLWPGAALGTALGVHLALSAPTDLAIAAPVLLGWILAPAIAERLGRPRRFRRETLEATERRFLRGIARRTWHFFDTFVGPDDHWLPPDNFQRSPHARLARRTSPTNIGLYLASIACARDLGFVGTPELAVRARYALDSLDALERHRGHLLNWYDTATLEPLEPRYVSTVDSGNLAVSLIALAVACRERAATAPIAPELAHALGDTLRLIDETLGAIETAEPAADAARYATEADTGAHATAARESLGDALDALASALGPEAAAVTARERLRELTELHWPRYEATLAARLPGADERRGTDDDALHELSVWVERFDHQLHALGRDLDHLAPWIAALERAPASASALVPHVADAWPLGTAVASAPGACRCAREALHAAAGGAPHDAATDGWRATVESGLDAALARQRRLAEELEAVAARCDALGGAMRFGWLYDESRRLFRIGYDVSSATLDANHYDLLASEARIASLFAIAVHEVPLEHWFALGRPVVRPGAASGDPRDSAPAAQSWNGSMFEYLMPPLFLPGKRDTFLGESESLAVLAQRRHAARLGIPWGVSESAYAASDADGNYQYRAFGVGALGIRRGLDEERVVAPYASLLALGVWPRAAVENLRRLHALGATGEYGYVDALDYTPTRAPAAGGFALVDAWMAHHQGMGLVAIGNVLDEDRSARRVLSEPRVRAVALLLQERVPWQAPTERTESTADTQAADARERLARPDAWLPLARSPIPQLQLLGHPGLATRIAREGGSALSAGELALTRPLADGATARQAGYRLHVHDGATGLAFRLGERPSADTPESRVVFDAHEVDLVQHLDKLTLRLETWVSPHEALEIRRVRLESARETPCTVRLLSHAEVVLAPPDDEERHPAFSKLFVESRVEPAHAGLRFRRRPREPDAVAPELLHRLVAADPAVALVGVESDRLAWLGRLGRDAAPRALGCGLSGASGFTLDPIMALEARVALAPGATVELAFATLVDRSPERLLERSARLSPGVLDRSRQDAADDAARELARLGIAGDALPPLQTLASLLIHPDARLRRVPPSVDEGGCGQPELWSVGLSGDLPLLVVRAGDDAPREPLETLVRAQALWRRRGLAVDLVVLREGPPGYEEPLRLLLADIVRDTASHGWFGRDGGVHLVSTAAASARLARAVEDAAAVVLDATRPLAEALEALLRVEPGPPPLVPEAAPVARPPAPPVAPAALEFDNGLGGFDPHGGDYVIRLAPGESTPAPWCNVLANAGFGSVVSEAGLGFSWATNSGEHRLTRWSCDPVADPPSEMLWLRDERSAEVWSPLPRPPFDEAAVEVRHGLGHTSWRRESHGLAQTLTALVPPDAPVKLVRLTLVEREGVPRRLSATYGVEWILGALPSRAKRHVRSGFDAESGAVLAVNPWDPDFAGRVAFLAASRPAHSASGDRREFVGARGDLLRPEGLERSDLGGRFAPGGDAGGFYQVHLDLPARGALEVVFVLGEGTDRAAAERLIGTWRDPARVETALAALAERWRTLTAAVQVRTPDRAFDLMVNRWLPYQTVASRLDARAGFYQAGGAFGFRDQLQDVLALLAADPSLARGQILAAAAHQFDAGDVLHWWHPPGERGVRTRFSDDMLWLPYALARYVRVTGDRALLDREVPFLVGAELAGDEHDRYGVWATGAAASLHEHGARAIERGLACGAHGLPLIGGGDWNDGMDRVGIGGRGESVWLAWFRIAVIDAFAPLAEARGETARAARWRAHAAALGEAIHREAWDGEWFVRAFDDAGLPWGSAACEECRIDAIAQAWGALAGDARDARVRRALEAAERELVDRGTGIVRLLTPPFHATARDPGYIKAYPPGIRENGGQYTHGACWLGLAFAATGDGARAHEVFGMICPVRRASTPAGRERYRREPYAVAADVGGSDAHAGLGGWSWYTGASGWAWQLGVRGLLGIEHVAGGVEITPCLPPDWDRVEVVLDSPDCGTIALEIENPEGVSHGVLSRLVDGAPCEAAFVPFPARGERRRVVVTLGESGSRDDEPLPASHG